jgi:hypothetical protein
MQSLVVMRIARARSPRRPAEALRRVVLVVVLVALVLASASVGLASAAHTKGYLYWTNYGVSGSGGTIGRANVDGTAANENFITGAHAPAGITVNGGYLYRSTFGSAHGINGTTIGRARLSGVGVTQHFISGAKSPAGVTASAA